MSKQTLAFGGKYTSLGQPTGFWIPMPQAFRNPKREASIHWPDVAMSYLLACHPTHQAFLNKLMPELRRVGGLRASSPPVDSVILSRQQSVKVTRQTAFDDYHFRYTGPKSNKLFSGEALHGASEAV